MPQSSPTGLLTRPAAQEGSTCYHCGLPAGPGSVLHDGRTFCCTGCKLVYDVLSEHRLYTYYSFEQSPGLAPSSTAGDRFAYLDDPGTTRSLLEFTNGATAAVTLSIPQMHCSSCIWLLEHLHRIDRGVLQSRVDFLKKTVRVVFTSEITSLRRIVELMATLGYEPAITLDTARSSTAPPPERALYTRVGVAGFCFANTMLLSFPEYFSGGTVDPDLEHVFRFVNLLLALPVVFYSAGGYFRSAAAGLARRTVTLDVPIALGILVQFLRSLFDIILADGPGYLDSMSGLVFFLLAGKVFQNKTYDSLRFDRDYTSYFPLAVTVCKGGEEISIPVSRLKAGDRVLLRNNEIAPADSVLVSPRSAVDYSFVTGESRPVELSAGDLIYAGARHLGPAIELEVVKEVSRSTLTRLWNDAASDRHPRGTLTAMADTVAGYFTAGVLAVSVAAAIVWLPRDPAAGWDAITGVLIIACPCALALAIPFAFGTAQRIVGRRGMYLRNASVVEHLGTIDTIVFDKTGTLTEPGSSEVQFSGDDLSPEHRSMVASLVRNSAHPLSRAILKSLGPAPIHEVLELEEVPGSGLAGTVAGARLRLGTQRFVANASDDPVSVTGTPVPETRVYLSIQGVSRGFFSVRNTYRPGIDDLLLRLSRRYRLAILSGDNDAERESLVRRFGGSVTLLFRQSPADKRDFVRALQDAGHNVMMVGDGLNDAGSLRESRVGIAITEDIAAFSPACDAILEARELSRLDDVLAFSISARRIVMGSFFVSFLYNVIGLTFAFQAAFTPIMAAILMPASSVSVVVLATATVRHRARRKGLA